MNRSHVQPQSCASWRCRHFLFVDCTADDQPDPVDTRTPVDDKDYQVPFRFTGKLAKLTIRVGPEQLAEADRKVMHEALRQAKD